MIVHVGHATHARRTFALSQGEHDSNVDEQHDEAGDYKTDDRGADREIRVVESAFVVIVIVWSLVDA